jgi:hypothetical protein
LYAAIGQRIITFLYAAWLFQNVAISLKKISWGWSMIVLPRFHNLVILPVCIEVQLESEFGLAHTPSVPEMVPIKPTRIGRQALR